MAGENRRVRVRMSLGVEFENPAAKAAFSRRLEHVRSLLTPPELKNLDNQGLLTAMFDVVERSVSSSLPGISRASSGPSEESTEGVSVMQSFNSNAGKLHVFH